MRMSSESFDQWACRPTFPDTSWISGAHALETEALTRALQMSLSSDDSSSAASSSSSALLHLSRPLPEVEPRRRVAATAAAPLPTGRIAKRKSRASKRASTMYITADPENFRQMVQQVTGAQLGAFGSRVEPVFKPEQQRIGLGGRAVGGQQGCCLPTLDTSAFFLDRIDFTDFLEPDPIGPNGSFGPGFDFDPVPVIPSFPTLESGSVMY